MRILLGLRRQSGAVPAVGAYLVCKRTSTTSSGRLLHSGPRL